MTTPLVIRVLGPLEVERAGTVLPIGSPMQRRLLTALVIAEGETVSTDRLVEALWAGDPPGSARNSLQTYVARLRDALGDPGVIVTRPPGYALRADDVTVDAWQLRQRVAAARAASDEEPERAAAALQEALALWRGDAYGEFADDLAREAAVQLEAVRAEAIELLARAQLAAGAPGDALSTLDRLPDAPLRESTVLLRAGALAAAGRLPDALTAIREHRSRLADDLGLDASAVVDDFERRLLRGDITSAVEPPSAGVRPRSGTPIAPPRLRTATEGREDDLARIDGALQAASLVTLVGPGGVGKTRLATEVANRAGRSAWIDLASVRSQGDVAAAFADGLGLVVPAGTPVEHAVVEGLGSVSGLVVIDNCEHVIDAVADLLDQALGRSSDVRIVATSRERLDLAGELVVPITPLPVPTPEEATAGHPAVRLFLSRLSAGGGPAVTPADAARVIAAVDGLPLAIELAAARAVALPLATLLERLHGQLDVLAGTRRRHGERHRTLAGVISWSHDLLEPSDQVLFRRLSVFSATFRHRDVEAICVDEQLPADAATTGLARLVDASMVSRVDAGRFRLLQPLRLYAAEQLVTSGDAPATYARQRACCLELTSRADEQVTGPDESAIMAEVEAALPDLRAVHSRAVEEGDLATVARMAAQLYRFAYMQARTDVLAWGADLADEDAAGVDAGDRARALAAAAAGSWMAGAAATAAQLLSTAYALAADPWSRITVTEAQGDLGLGVGDLDAAVAAYQENLACANEVGHEGLAAVAEAGLALALFQRGERQRSREVVEQSLRRAIGGRVPSAQALAEYTLGEILADDDPDAALAALARARALAIDRRLTFIEGLARTADVALRGRHGDPREALGRYGEALRLWRDSGAAGLLLTTLRNLVVLLVRIGADHAALQLHEVTERVGSKPSYGDEARRRDAAVAAARERLASQGPPPGSEASQVQDLRAAAGLALDMVASVLAELPSGRHGGSGMADELPGQA